MRALLIVFAVLALAGCSNSAEGGEGSSREHVYVAYLEEEGIVPTYGDAETALTLGRQICDRYDQGDSFEAVIETLTDNEIPAHEAGQINGAATTAFCPEHETP